MITIENKFLKASFITKGAEWRSFYDKTLGSELLWQADPAFWGKSAPVLFPIVGSLKDGRYEYRGKSYSLPRHGFARDREFRVHESAADRVVFALEADDETHKVFPFEWELLIEYRLEGRSLATTYRVKNRGEELWFSIGAHPAFALPFQGRGAFEDATLEFEKDEPLTRWLLNDQGVLSGESRPVPQVKNTVAATRPLFAEDALVLKGLKSQRLSIRQKNSPVSLTMDFPGFPLFGIWTAPGAPFLCLEPWCGVADSVTATGKLEEKEGIEHLRGASVFERTFKVAISS